MRKLTCFLLVFLSSFSGLIACGSDLGRENIRFALFNPELFVPKNFHLFNYSTYLFADMTEDNGEGVELNCILWQARTKKQIDIKEVYKAIYLGKNGNIDSNNLFIKELLYHRDTIALNYLKFAKDCEKLNTYLRDPWERYEIAENVPLRNNNIRYAVKMAENLRDIEMAKRFAFIAIRLSFYNQDYTELQSIYSNHFDPENDSLDILDYWAMHFYVLGLKRGELSNMMAARVFMNAPDKKYAVHYAYSDEFPVENTLKICRTNKDKASVYTLSAIRKTGRCKKEIEEIYKTDPSNEGFIVLLSRELSKIEDWVFTPYFKGFDPSLLYDYESNTSIRKRRMERDREYTRTLLAFLYKVNPSTTANPEFVEYAKGYLQLITKNYSQAVGSFRKLNQQKTNSEEKQESYEKMLTIAEVFNLQNPMEIPLNLQDKIMKLKETFLFTVARELEFRGNTTEGAYLLSKEDTEEWSNNINYSDYYSDYYYYLNDHYSLKQLSDLIDNFRNLNRKSAYNNWKSEQVAKDIDKLIDLLGTKHLRLNQLQSALRVFKKANPDYWKNDFYTYYLNINPFYANFYSGHEKTEADSLGYNKIQIVEQLITYLEKANNPQEKHRDYYYMLVGNCYFNMSKHGNAWAMKRYYWSYHSNSQSENKPDNADYYRCEKAKKYFIKASQLSKDKKFAAMCLRMAGRCEKEALLDIAETNGESDLSELIFNQNKTYQKLRQKYPEYYEDLISNCHSHQSILAEKLKMMEKDIK